MAHKPGYIRVLLSSRVIFDLEEADKIFAEKGANEYRDYMLGQGAYAADYDKEYFGRQLKPGPLFHLVQGLTRLNEISPGAVEIGLVCKDEQDTALPIFRNLDLAKLDVQFRMATAGNALLPADLEAFKADMFFSRNATDTQMAVDHDVAAATINFPPGAVYSPNNDGPVSLYYDIDGVLVGDSAEMIYKEKGLADYIQHEFNNVASVIEPGPWAKAVAKISELNDKFPRGEQPFELSALTARGYISAARAIASVSNAGIKLNGRIFCISAGGTGVNKTGVLKAHMPDLFLDDQQTHLKDASLFMPTGHVPYKTGSTIFMWMQQKAAEAAAANNNPAAPTPSSSK